MFGSDGSPIIQYLVIFAVIFSVLAAIVFLVRRLTGGGGALQTRGARSRQPRLGIVDVYELDRSRQLILLRRDNVEHLLLVGGPNDVVVERNIQRGQRALAEPALRAEPAAEPLPDPLAEAGRLPEPPRAIAEPARAIGETAARRPPATFEMPVVVPSPVPGSLTPPPVRRPLDAGLIGGDEPGRDIPLPGPTPSPPPTLREPFVRPRTLRTTPPSLDRQPEPARPVETARPSDAGLVLPPLTPPPGEPRPVDPSILSDMARQLQAAIARPSSAAAPPPAAPSPAAAPVAPPARNDALARNDAKVEVKPEPKPEPRREIDPIAAGMAALETAPVDPVAAAMAAPVPAEPRDPEPVARSPEPPAPALPPARPARAPEKARPASPRTEPAAPKAEPKSPGNPFSVEEIEAEFARLLGRPLDKRG
ncbi:flagellar biosynthetic protein FliO [Methylobacterium sp. J-076]|uniref:flagellar biosynthetic protein FliO n=1 Tax=Methylobacterium sp. J-076 TaxID=2836655 RepID=UPI001FBBAB40|nr:flagellar biosynthetic protein FliO [Methylobacterium sp. J-076]MCJ2011339.1 flagellar biosynthetic protein FliO [Methylobacterium sp. J-076]